MIKTLANRIGFIRLDASLYEVVRVAAVSFIIQTGGALMGLAIALVIARLQGADGMGIYYLAMSVVAVASTVGRVGLDNTVVRYVAYHASTGDWASVLDTNRSAIKIAGVVSCCIAVVVLAGSSFLSETVFHKEFLRLPIIVAACGIVPYSIAMIYAESLRGVKYVRSSQVIKNVSFGIGTLILIYPALGISEMQGGVIAYTASVTAASVAAWYLWRRAFGRISVVIPRDVPSDPGRTKQLVRESRPLFGVSISNLVILYGSTMMLGMWGKIEDVGVFNAANRVTGLFLFPLFGMISILSPKFAEMHHRGDAAGMANLARQSSKLLILSVVPTGTVVFIGARWVLSVFGPEFVPGEAILRVLLVGAVFNVSTGAVAELLMMTGYGHMVNRIVAFGAAVIIVLSFILMPSYGGLGAAIALSAGTVMINVIMVFSVKNTLGFWPIPPMGRGHPL